MPPSARKIQFFCALLGLLLHCACATQDPQVAPTKKDFKGYAILAKGATDWHAAVAKNSVLFDHAADSPLSVDEHAQLLSLWAPFIDHDLAFGSFREKFLWHWQNAKGPAGQMRALTLGLAAHVELLRGELTLMNAAANKDVFIAALNEADEKTGVSSGNYDRIAMEIVLPQSLTILQIGADALRKAIKRAPAATNPEEQAVQDFAQKTLTSAQEVALMYKARGIALIGDVSTMMIDNVVHNAIAQTQLEIASWLGDSRLDLVGHNLITEDQVAQLQKLLQPGDIIVERRNWYLSNLGLPGFWPHAELHIGTPTELANYFDTDPSVLAVFPDGFAVYLAATYPDHWAEYIGVEPDGEPVRIVEAISEGVSLSSLREACLSDYLGAMRPTLSKLQKAYAIDRAFANIGKPYDFDFDFLTNATLVCSELVYDAYQAPASEGASLNFPLSDVMGRIALPPTDMVSYFDQTYDTPSKQLEFVAFLDAHELSGNATFSDIKAFRQSWKRPKWDLNTTQ